MIKAQLLSVLFSLVMFTGLTAGTATYAESDDYDHDFDDKLEYFCQMTDQEKDQLFEDHPRLAEFKERLANFCGLDEDDREEMIEAFIEEHFPNYKGHDEWDLEYMLDRYCEMSAEEKLEFVEKYPLASANQDKMDEYCTLNESEREAFIEEHEDEYEKDHDYKKHDYGLEDVLEKYCEMTDAEKTDFVGMHNKTEDHKSKMDEYCTLNESEREAFIEEHEDEYEKDHDYKKHDYNMREKMNKFCEMSEDEIADMIEEHPAKEEHFAEMEEYCSLDDEGKDAFIEAIKEDRKDKMADHKDAMKDKISDHKDAMKDKISDHKERIILRASTLTDEQKDNIKAMHTELRDFKHSLRDKSISDVDKQEIHDQFMEMAKEFSMTWLSPRHQVAAGIDAQKVECREGFSLVMKTSNSSPMCVKETTAQKLVERGIAISAI